MRKNPAQQRAEDLEDELRNIRDHLDEVLADENPGENEEGPPARNPYRPRR